MLVSSRNSTICSCFDAQAALNTLQCSTQATISVGSISEAGAAKLKAESRSWLEQGQSARQGVCRSSRHNRQHEYRWIDIAASSATVTSPACACYPRVQVTPCEDATLLIIVTWYTQFLQAFWRGKHAVGVLRGEVRSSWQAAYGGSGERATQYASCRCRPLQQLHRTLCVLCISLLRGLIDRAAVTPAQGCAYARRSVPAAPLLLCAGGG